MDLQRFAIKVYLEDPSKLDPKALIPVFHRWIQERAIPDHLLIDVADYSHVPHGPGVMLMTREGHFSLDNSDQRLGLMYTRKQSTEGSFGERFQAVLRATLQAHQLLAQEADLSGAWYLKMTNLYWWPTIVYRRRTRRRASKPSGTNWAGSCPAYSGGSPP